MRLIRSILDAYTRTGKFWLIIATLALVVDAAISYQYGISLSWWHGLGFALVAMFFALLPDAAYSEIESRRIVSGVMLSALCVPLGIVAFYSHLGYGAGVRLGDIQQTGVQNTKYDDAREKVADNKRNLALWTKQLDSLQTEAPWVATVSADGLRAQIPAMDKAIELETRRGGCGPKCQKLMEAKASTEDRIAKAEQRIDLEKRIAATQKLVDTYREQSAGTELVSSNVVNQTNVAAQLYLAMTGANPEAAIKPDTVTASFANIFIAGGGSIAFMIMAPIGFFVAGRNRKPEPHIEPTRIPAASSVPAVPQTRTIIERVTETASKLQPVHHRTISLCHA